MATYYIGSMAFSDGSDILHYGVKGMKWGVRKEPELVGGGRRIRRAQKMQARILRSNSKLEKYKNTMSSRASAKTAKKISRTKDPEKQAKLKADLNKKLSAIKKMNVKDMNRAKIRKGLSILGGVLGGALAAGLIAAAGALGTAVALGVLTGGGATVTIGGAAAGAIYAGGAAAGAASAAKRSDRRTVKKAEKQYN